MLLDSDLPGLLPHGVRHASDASTNGPPLLLEITYARHRGYDVLLLPSINTNAGMGSSDDAIMSKKGRTKRWLEGETGMSRQPLYDRYSERISDPDRSAQYRLSKRILATNIDRSHHYSFQRCTRVVSGTLLM